MPDAPSDPRLADGLARLGLSAKAITLLSAYLDELYRWNQAYNLTSVRQRADMLVRHVLDCAAITPHLPLAPSRLLDVGSGPGLPGLVVALLRPDWHVTCLDSNGKMCRFTRHAIRTLGLANAEVVESRIEAFQPSALFDHISSRAFSALDAFIASTDAHLSPHGCLWAMKARADEVDQALPPHWQAQVHPLSVPFLNEPRCLIQLSRC
jgi:16S rRNA (guanine527-N7)-methyltransferase